MKHKRVVQAPYLISLFLIFFGLSFSVLYSSAHNLANFLNLKPNPSSQGQKVNSNQPVLGSAYTRSEPYVTVSTGQESFGSGGVISLTSEEMPVINVNTSEYDVKIDSVVEIYEANEDVLMNYLIHDEKGSQLNKSVDTSKLKKIANFSQLISSQSKITLPITSHGVWVMRIIVNGRIRDSIIVRSLSGVYVTQGKDKYIFWGQNFQTGKSIPDGALQLFKLNGSKSQIANIKLNNQGVAETLFRKEADIALFKSGDDLALIPLNLRYLNYGTDDFIYFAPRKITQNYFLFTDRPLYKPGDTVYFKAIIRDEDDVKFSLPKEKFKVRISQSYDYQNPIFETIAETSEQGSLDGEFKLPAETKTGFYTLFVDTNVKDDKYYYPPSSLDFQVEYYKKPEYTLEINTPKNEYIQGENATVEITGKYFSGHPLASQQVKYTIYSVDSYQYEYITDRESAILGDFSYRGFGGEKIIEEAVKLDKNGKAVIKVPTKIMGGKFSNQIFSIEASVEDGSLNPSFARKNILINSGFFEIFRQDYQNYGRVGEKFQVPLVLVGKNEKTSGKELKAKLSRQWWDKKINLEQKYPEYFEQTEDLGEWTTTTDHEAKGIFEILPKASGTYILTVTGEDSKKNKIARKFSTYVTGENVTKFDQRPVDFNIQSDKVKYQPGDTANLTINSNLENRDLFLTVERESVFSYQVLSSSGHIAKAQIQLLADYMPNVSANVASFSPTNYQGEASQINVSAESQRLKVQINPQSEKFGPSDTVNLELKVETKDGSSVEGEATVFVVDKAIFELSDLKLGDIFTKFYGERYGSATAGHSLEGISVNQRGGGGGCFSGETTVLTKDGQKPIKNIKPGDTILTWDLNSKSLLEAKVSGTNQATINGYLLINGSLKVSEDHKIYVNDEFKEAGSIQPGDYLLDSNGKKVLVDSILYQAQKIEVYNLIVDVYHTFIAGGILVHNDKGLTRTVFADTAYWNPKVKINSQGEANITFKLPDNLTTWVIAAVVTTPDTKVGQVTKEIITSKDIVLRPVLPNIMRTTDKLVVSSLLQNFTDKKQKINLQGTFDSGDLSMESPSKIQLNSKQTEQSYWGIIPKKENEHAKLRLSAESEGQVLDAVIHEIPVREYGFLDKKATTGIGDKDFSILLSSQINPEKSKINLTLAPTLLSDLVNAFEYLLNYPYGCVEQTTSRLVPLIIAKSHPELAKGLKNQDLDLMIAKGLDNIEQLQRGDGGWAWWNQGPSNPFVTSYVVSVLVDAKKNGFKVKQSILNDAQRYLEEEQIYDQNINQSVMIGAEEATIKRYGLSLLGIRKNFNFPLEGTILSPELKALQLMADMNNGVEDASSSATAKLSALAQTEGESIYWDKGSKAHFGSEDASTALVIQALIQAKADKDQILKAARYLSYKKRFDYWSNTYATSQVIKALVLAGGITEELSPNFSYQVILDGKELTKGTVNKTASEPVTISIPVEKISKTGSKLNVVKNGQGELYSTLIINEFNTSTNLQAESKTLNIKREYIKDDETNTPLQVGDIVSVKFRVSGLETDDNFLVIEDNLPSGLAPINFNLQNQQYNDPQYKWDGVEKQVSENGMIITAYQIFKGENEYSYKARVVAEGEFIAPPATATLMYSPEIYAKSATEVIKTQRQIEPKGVQKFFQDIKNWINQKNLLLWILVIALVVGGLIVSFLIVRNLRKIRFQKPKINPPQDNI